MNLYNIRSKVAWAASTLGVISLGFSMFALVAIAKGDDKFEKEVKVELKPKHCVCGISTHIFRWSCLSENI